MSRFRAIQGCIVWQGIDPLSQDPLSAEQARGLLRRVREKEMEAVAEAARHVAEAEAAPAGVFLQELCKVLEGFRIMNPGENCVQTWGSMWVCHKTGWFHTQHDQHLWVTFYDLNVDIPDCDV